MYASRQLFGQETIDQAVSLKRAGTGNVAEKLEINLTEKTGENSFGSNTSISFMPSNFGDTTTTLKCVSLPVMHGEEEILGKQVDKLIKIKNKVTIPSGQ